MESDKKQNDNPSPENKADICSKLFFCWTLPFFKYGYKNNLKMKDVYNATKDDVSGQLGDVLENYWETEVKLSRKQNRRPSLQRAIFKTFFKTYGVIGIFVFIYSVIIRLLQPLVLGEFIRYFETPYDQRKLEYGWTLGVFIVLLVLTDVTLEHFISLRCQRIGMRIRIACCSLMYRKLLKLNQSSLGMMTSGKLINLLSNDVQRFDLAATYFHYIWTMPLHFIVAFYIMYRSVGVATVAGMVLIIIQALPVQGCLSKLQGKLRYKIALRTDQRVKLMSEITSGIQVIKMYAWEIPFQKVVAQARKLEIDIITKTLYITGMLDGTWIYSEKLCLYLTLITHLLLGHKLTGDIVFFLVQLYNVIQYITVGVFRLGTQYYSEARASMKRIEEFLMLEQNEKIKEMITNGTTNGTSNGKSVGIDTIHESKKGTIAVTNANCEWLPKSNTLSNINLIVQPGTLCCIVGNVGSGKSSVLQLLLNELPLLTGESNVYGKISYSSQNPWLFSSNVKNNILFGKPYDQSRYSDIIKVCALEKDLQQFPHGDNSLVGERGVSLSGGQKARINLARAIYTEADIYLLDDPLSAVDTRVGKHLFEQCIKKYLNNKTRILVTHQLQFLKEADKIIVMNDGQIVQTGTFDELAKDKLDSIKRELDGALEVTKGQTGESKESDDIPTELPDEGSPTIIAEEMEEGAVPLSTYIEYWRSGTGVLMLVVLVFFLIIAQVASNSCELFLREWTNQEISWDLNKIVINITDTENINDTYYEIVNKTDPVIESMNDDQYIQKRNYNIIIYTICIISSIALVNLRSVIFFKTCMNNSKALHRKMFSCILQAPMRFFDTNPSGRILNRFSKDTGAIDELLPPACFHAIQIVLILLGILILIFIVSPLMIVPAVFLGLLFYFIRKIYLASAQDIKRLEGIARAPVFSHTTASMNGLATIRAAKAQQLVIKEFDILQDEHTGAWYLFVATSETFGMYLDMISVIFIAVITFQFLSYGEETTLAGNVGLVMSQSLMLTGMLQFGVRQTADIASHMVSVERVLQYTKLDKEVTKNYAPIKVKENQWPHSGKIIMRRMSMRYSPGDPYVLKNFNLDIQPKEKIGIVGRTGAGKSSMIAALFRLAPVDGLVTIDDIDTATIDLKTLRSSISIIPQEPILFSGTIRYNLDPFETVDDATLWKALENVELKHVITDLNQTVSEGGVNFSVGQRQLICLARAIVRNNKVLVMDEATANVDHVTDALIQRTIRENFKDCTVLTIAHRLNTIMDSDKVLVVESGCAMEFDHAHKLLQNLDGYFTRMLRETGVDMESTLRKVAEDDYKMKFEL